MNLTQDDFPTLAVFEMTKIVNFLTDAIGRTLFDADDDADDEQKRYDRMVEKQVIVKERKKVKISPTLIR